MASGFLVPLRRRSELEARGHDSRSIKRALTNGGLVLLRRGVYARTSELSDLTAEDRAVIRARAYAMIAAVPPVFAGRTAAALHGLPLLLDDEKVHVLSSEGRPSSGYGIVRHRGDLREDDVTRIRGLHCTSLTRTVVDLARWDSREAGVSAADAALRRVAFTPPGAYDEDAANTFREAMIRMVRNTSHGHARAHRAVRFSDGRAAGPGESVSRLRLDELGFEAPALQVPVEGPSGSTFFVDFGLEEAGAWGEFDGKIKYRGLAAAAGRTPHEVVEREKQREDWIRGTTRRRVVRWGWDDIRDAATLGRRLAAFGVRPRG